MHCVKQRWTIRLRAIACGSKILLHVLYDGIIQLPFSFGIGNCQHGNYLPTA